MKKSLILALVLSALLLVTVMAISVSADPSLGIGEVTFTKDIENNLVTFTVPYTANEVEQIVVLAVKGTEDAEPDVSDVNLVYIYQQSSVDGNSFIFSVPYSEFSEALPYCWIKIGGTSITTAKSNGGEEIWVSAPALPIITCDDVLDNNVESANVAEKSFTSFAKLENIDAVTVEEFGIYFLATDEEITPDKVKDEGEAYKAEGKLADGSYSVKLINGSGSVDYFDKTNIGIITYMKIAGEVIFGAFTQLK